MTTGNFVPHPTIPRTNVGVGDQITEGVAALDGGENAVDSQVAQVGLESADERSFSFLQLAGEVTSLVVQRLSDVVLEGVALLQAFPDEIHGSGADVDDEALCPEQLFPVSPLKWKKGKRKEHS